MGVYTPIYAVLVSVLTIAPVTANAGLGFLNQEVSLPLGALLLLILLPASRIMEIIETKLPEKEDNGDRE